MMFRKRQTVFSFVISLLLLGTLIVPAKVSAATSTYLYSCPEGTTQFIVRQPSEPYVTCWTDTNNNGQIEQSDSYTGPTRHISGEAEDGYSVAEVTCANSEPRESSNRFSCPDGSVPSVIIRGAQHGEEPTGDTSNQSSLKNDCNPESGQSLNRDNCKIVDYLVLFIKTLSGLVGIVIVIMMIIGGIQYSTARGNPQAVAAARQRIYNALLALVTFIFAFAFLQWLVPGGIL